MKKHGDVKRNVKVDTKVKQLMTSETQKLKTDVDFQKESNIGVSSDVFKEKFQSYSKKLKLPKMKKPKSNGEKKGTHGGSIVKKFKGMVHEGSFYVCQICRRCLYKRSIQHFERNIKNESSNPINAFSFDGCLYICKNCHKNIAEGKVLCQSVSNKLEVCNFPSHFCEIQKLEKVLIAKRLLFKKITIMPRGEMENISDTICNIPIDTTNVTNMLPRAADSNGLVIIKLKRKLEYHGHVLFEPVRPVFLKSILNYLKTNNHLYQDVVINTENISLDGSACTSYDNLDTSKQIHDVTSNCKSLSNENLNIPVIPVILQCGETLKKAI